MATLVLTAVTGAGKSGFGTNVTVQNSYAHLVVPGWSVRFAGIGTVRTVHQVGWYGLGWDGGGAVPDLISWGRWFQWESEYLNVTPGFLAYADTFFWELSLGTSCDFEVDY